MADEATSFEIEMKYMGGRLRKVGVRILLHEHLRELVRLGG